jgi:BASS family bile acid:Na+ symporter
MYAMGYHAEVGPFAVAFFIALAIGVRGTPLKGLSFTVWIFASVTTSMFYPKYFLEIGGFQLKRLIIPLMQIIMFGMGTTMGLKDFAGVIKMPKAVFAGLLCQYTIMPFVGLALAKSFGFPNEIAAGVVLIGSSPCGLASNVMNYIAGSNLALSITLTAVATIIAPIMTPLMMKMLANQFVEISFVAMMIDVFKIVIVPIVAGLIFHKVAHGRAKWLDRSMPILSMVGIAYIVTIITAAGRDGLLEVGKALVVAAMLHNGLGYFLGYWGGRLFRLDERSCRTIAIEVGLQNGGLASGIALKMGKIATMGLAPAVFGPWMNISGSALANWWRSRPVKDVTPLEKT